MTAPEADASVAAMPHEDGSRRRMVARDDLVARLDRAAERKVTIISAPAGSGKTSLLRAWANRPGPAQRIASTAVRRDEQDGQLFWLTLLNAVRSGARDAQPPASTPDLSLPTLADRVQAELAGRSGRVIMVIDDLHELNSPDARAQLTRLLTHLPPNGHAILATRHDLPLGLHQLRLAGELAEIRAADLRFSEREARELLDASGIALSAAGAARLHQRTEGWAAGLRLAVLPLAGHPDPERFVAEFSGSDHTVAEYLISEMLDRQPAAVQDLLLRTCLLDRVNGELADLLTGHPGSERILLDLEDANAFVVSLDAGRTWFRYHHLLSDFLRLELRRTLPAEVPALHRRAAGWLTGHGRVADAIRHTQAAGDWAAAARLLADHAFSMMLDGQASTIRALLRTFPPGTDHSELALVRAMSDLILGHLEEATAYLAVAESHGETAPPDRQRRLGVAIAALKVALARRRGHLAGVLDQVKFLASGASRDTSGAVLRWDEPDQLRQGTEDNLTTLGVSRLAAVNLRVMDPSVSGQRFDAQLAALIRAREEGLIDGVGLSNITRPQLLRAVGQTEIVCVQNLFNLAYQRSPDVLTECTNRKIAFVPFSPLGWPGDVRRDLLATPVLTALGARLHATPGQVALAWLLDLAPNILLIPGTRTRAHLTENLGAADVVLDDDARAELARHFPAG